MNKKKQHTEHDIQEGKMYALLSYLSILCIIPLLFKKENSFVLSHGRQGLVIFVCQVGVFILHIMVGYWFLKLGIFILGICSFTGLIAVLKGQELKIPLIYDLAEKITL